MAAIYAVLGAIAGIALIVMGLRVHIGTLFLDGPLGYVVSACLGAGLALIIRHVIRRQYGPIIP